MNNLRDLLILNLTLQVFDGLFSYQLFYAGFGVESLPNLVGHFDD